MKNWRLNTLLVMAIVLAIGLGTQTAQASVLTLADLINHTNGSDGTLTVDDKVFSNFTVTQSAFPGLTTEAEAFNVSGSVIGPGLDELSFAGSNLVAGCGPSSSCSAGTADVTIGYTVSTVNGAPLIHDIELNFDGHALNGSNGTASVAETAFVGGAMKGRFLSRTQSPLLTTQF